MKRKSLFITIGVVAVFLVAAFLAGKAFATVNCFTDTVGNWAETEICWLKDHGVASGYGGGLYGPNDHITRAEMAVMLKNEAGTLVAAGAHVGRDGSNNPVITDWFNNVNGTAPTVSGSNGDYLVNFHFDVSTRFVLCSVDANYTDSRDALCTTHNNWFSPGSQEVIVYIYDVSLGHQGPAAFWLLVYGK
jgi:hypothetical protein